MSANAYDLTAGRTTQRAVMTPAAGCLLKTRFRRRHTSTLPPNIPTSVMGDGRLRLSREPFIVLLEYYQQEGPDQEFSALVLFGTASLTSPLRLFADACFRCPLSGRENGLLGSRTMWPPVARKARSEHVKSPGRFPPGSCSTYPSHPAMNPFCHRCGNP
jgi:hypothetical protein